MNSQVGNLPFTEPKYDINFYNQVNINYRYQFIRLYTRYEGFWEKDKKRYYGNFNQYRLEIKYNRWNLKAGHFYDMFGRGLLLRAYEIPETIYEDAGYRVRHGFYRDIFGVSGAYKGKSFSLHSIYGKPLINLLPPTLQEAQRREDKLFGISGSFNLSRVRFSTSYINNIADKNEAFLSYSLNTNLGKKFDFYMEYAHQNGDYFSFEKNNRFAIYGNLNFYYGAFAASLEYKNYNLFLLGSGYNDPPNLVKEHTYPLLNRSTHINILENERGYQLEGYYKLNSTNQLTGNVSFGQNQLSKMYHYYEYFLQWEWETSNENTLILFLDYSKDEVQGEENRITGGINSLGIIGSGWSFKLDIESQHFNRLISNQENIVNHYAAITLFPTSSFSFSTIWEWSNDQFLTDKPQTTEIETMARNWFAINLSYRPNTKNRIEFFAGQRRGGPACTSGICFEVLDFEGVELKWVTRI